MEKIKKTQNMKEYKKQYYINNADRIKTNFKNWIQNNNPYEKIECNECKVYINRCSMSKHRKTYKHRNHVNRNNLESINLEINSNDDLKIK